MKTRISELDTLIRQGKSRLARRGLEAWLKDRKPNPSVEHPYLAQLCALCRRSGIPGAGVKLLNPIVRPKPRMITHSSPLEKAEYAAALAQIGAEREARALLDSLDPRETPEALLYGAFARFSTWDYKSSIPLLEKYVAHGSLAPYQRRIGQVNLLAALVAVEDATGTLHSRAGAIAETLLYETREEGNWLLHGNTLGLLAQLRVAQRDFAHARALLGDAEKILTEAGTLDAIYIRKWLAICCAGDAPADAAQQLEEVKEQARARSNWETIRDCDFQLGRLSRNREKLTQVYFGTPYASYRERIASELQEIPDCLIWPGHTPTPKLVLDTRTGESSRKSLALKPGQIPHRLLCALVTDFYKPLTLPAIHAQLFPDRYFNPVSSPAVVHQAVKRLRAWLSENSLPITVEENRGRFRIESRGSAGLRIFRSPTHNSARLDGLIARLRSKVPETFSRSEVAHALGLSQRAANLLIAEAKAQGFLLQLGSGPATCYKLGA